jgi:hypothetical protein
MTHVNSKSAAAATPIDYASIARVASAVELRDIALRSSRANLNVDAAEIPDRWSGEAFVGFDSTVAEYPAEGQDFAIRTSFVAVYHSGWGEQALTELPPIDPASPPEIEIQATFELSYSSTRDGELAAEDLDNFALANATLHAWPYWRELADDITMRMHVPRLVVGVFKIPSRHDPGGRPEEEPASETQKSDPDAPGSE